MFFLHIFSAYIVFGRITRYLHPLFLHSSYFRTRESFPLVSFPFFFHSASYSSFFPRMCIIFIDVIIAFLFSRVDFPYLCVTRVHARARAHVRQKERMRAYPRVYVLCLWIHTRFFLWLCCHIHALVRIVCVSLRVRVSVMVSDRKKGGAERGKEQGRSICV